MRTWAGGYAHVGARGSEVRRNDPYVGGPAEDRVSAISAIIAGATPRGVPVACRAGLFATRATKVVQNA